MILDLKEEEGVTIASNPIPGDFALYKAILNKLFNDIDNELALEVIGLK